MFEWAVVVFVFLLVGVVSVRGQITARDEFIQWWHVLIPPAQGEAVGGGGGGGTRICYVYIYIYIAILYAE